MHTHLLDCLATLAELLAPLPEVCLGYLRPAPQLNPITLQLNLMALQSGLPRLQLSLVALQSGLPHLQLSLLALQSGLPHLQLRLPVAQVNRLQGSCIMRMQSMCNLLARLLRTPGILALLHVWPIKCTLKNGMIFTLLHPFYARLHASPSKKAADMILLKQQEDSPPSVEPGMFQ